jgi:hypothetical protein
MSPLKGNYFIDVAKAYYNGIILLVSCIIILNNVDITLSFASKLEHLSKALCTYYRIGLKYGFII